MTKESVSIFISCCLMFMVIAFDQNGLGIMLPQIRQELTFSSYAQMWIINIYLLTLACFIITAGKLADYYDIHKIFIIGNIIFLAGSIGCGTTNVPYLFMLFRAIQGVGAAFTLPLTFILVIMNIPINQQSNLIGRFIGITTVFFIIAPYVCGFITEYLGWRMVFILNIPICFISCWLISRNLTSSQTSLILMGFDYKGAALLILMLGCYMYGIIFSIYNGVLNKISLSCLITGSFLLWLLIKNEKYTKNPLISITIFKNKAFVLCIGAAFCVQGTIVVPIILSIYLQMNLHLKPSLAGFYIMIATIPSILSPFFCGKINAAFGIKYSLQIGFIVLTIGLSIMSISGYLKMSIILVSGLFIYSIAITPLLSVLINYSLSLFTQKEHGIISSIINLSRQIGAQVSMATMSFIAYHYHNNQLTMSDLSFSLSILLTVLLCISGLLMASRLKDTK